MAKPLIPKGKILPYSELLNIAVIKRSDVEEMKRLTHPTLQPFINAVPIRSKQP
jgi:hypothetical protein